MSFSTPSSTNSPICIPDAAAVQFDWLITLLGLSDTVADVVVDAYRFFPAGGLIYPRMTISA
jgi:hypothetical protein